MRHITRVAAVALLAVVLGCTAPGPPTVPVAKVSGTVKLDGKPMGGGEVRFNVPGQPPKSMEIHDGAFSGDAFLGKNQVDVVWDKDGPPNPMDPTTKTKVNVVADQFSGPGSSLKADVAEGAGNTFSFDVTSKH